MADTLIERMESAYKWATAENDHINPELVCEAIDALESAVACLRHTHDRLIDHHEFETLRMTINAEVRALKRGAPRAAVVAIKPLAWEEIGEARAAEDPRIEVSGWEAGTAFGTFYVVQQCYQPDGFMLEHDHRDLGTFPDPEAARAAGQKHHDDLIRQAFAA